LFRKDDIVRDMAACIGEVRGVELYALGATGTSFVRVRVKINVNKPLIRVVGLHPEGQERVHFQVMYEKLPRFCDVCGMFGHTDQDCGDGVHSEMDKQYGDWMIAPVEDWHPSTTGARNKAPPKEGYRGGQGGGRGSATDLSRKRPPGEELKSQGVNDSSGLVQITDGSGKDEVQAQVTVENSKPGG
jgi:hypothetical protein